MGEVKRNVKTLQDLDLVSETLRESSAYGLTAEVFLWALYYIKEHPETTIEDALNAGRKEWDI